MLGNAAHASTAIELLAAGSKAATANATGSWVAVSEYEEKMVIVQDVGAVTGSIAGKLQHADDNSGTNLEDVTGAAFTSATAAGIQKIVVNTNGLKPYVRYIGTIVTGPAVCSVTALAVPKVV
jgi:hypothetical protein